MELEKRVMYLSMIVISWELTWSPERRGKGGGEKTEVSTSELPTFEERTEINEPANKTEKEC